MKQPDTVRKALTMLIAPLALTALPAGAQSLEVTNFNGYNDFFVGTDENNNQLVFYSPSDGECSVVGFITENTSLTIPQTITKISEKEVYDDENGWYWVPDTIVQDVREVRITTDYEWNVNVFENAPNLKDVVVNNNVAMIRYDYPYSDRAVNLHFTTDTAPGFDIRGKYLDYGMESRRVIFAPEASVDSYSDALLGQAAWVLAEGTDPDAAFAEEVAAIGALQIIRNDESGIRYAEWIGEVNGTTFGFSGDDNMSFRGVRTSESSVSVPTSVYISFPEEYAYRVMPVVYMHLDYQEIEEFCFPDCDNLQDIYLPETIASAEWWGANFTNKYKFHFCTPEVPSLYFYNGCDSYDINIVVP
ncbi:MAG: hypothetical protein K2K95_08915, partial [Muribaculaceae bacterium]|nr:hypothetical protein [Muribaculaceae bacterium]